jgi:Ca2+:H+ antiporter
MYLNATFMTSPLIQIGFYSVMALLIPAAYFAALDRGVTSTITTNPAIGNIVTDAARGDFLKMSRGLSIIILFM